MNINIDSIKEGASAAFAQFNAKMATTPAKEAVKAAAAATSAAAYTAIDALCTAAVVKAAVRVVARHPMVAATIAVGTVGCVAYTAYQKAKLKEASPETETAEEPADTAETQPAA